jgi:hypothetical protein
MKLETFKLLASLENWVGFKDSIYAVFSCAEGIFVMIITAFITVGT